MSLIVDSVELKDVGSDDISFELVHLFARFFRLDALEQFRLQSESRKKTDIDK